MWNCQCINCSANTICTWCVCTIYKWKYNWRQKTKVKKTVLMIIYDFICTRSALTHNFCVPNYSQLAIFNFLSFSLLSLLLPFVIVHIRSIHSLTWTMISHLLCFQLIYTSNTISSIFLTGIQFSYLVHVFVLDGLSSLSFGLCCLLPAHTGIGRLTSVCKWRKFVRTSNLFLRQLLFSICV